MIHFIFVVLELLGTLRSLRIVGLWLVLGLVGLSKIGLWLGLGSEILTADRVQNFSQYASPRKLRSNRCRDILICRLSRWRPSIVLDCLKFKIVTADRV